MEGDARGICGNAGAAAISIHSLRMEGDVENSKNFLSRPTFQSTPSAWRETCRLPSILNLDFISIHSLRMEGDYSITHPVLRQACISIHSLRMEGDCSFAELVCKPSKFQSTPSAWRETRAVGTGYIIFRISIHSLRMEGDSKTAQESVFHFAYPCTILQKRMQKTTFPLPVTLVWIIPYSVAS